MRRKENNLVKIIGTGVICVALLFGSYTLGVYNTQNKTMPVTKNKNTLVKDTAEKSGTIDTIAIVNADVGTTVNGNPVNYATRLIPALKDNFVITNLEAARSGVEKGNYAGYIVIPSNFSQNVESLNSTPTPTELEYSIYPNLVEDSRVNVIYDIVDFEKTLNQSMSYMYLSSILNEFHAVQNGSSTIMSNDQKDKDMLLSIKPSDLTSLVKIPELVKTDNSVSPLDVSSYNNKSQEDINNIDKSYEYYVSLSKSDIELMQAQGNTLTDRFAKMQDHLDQINLTTDESGTNVYEAGVSNLKSSIENYNTTVLAEKETEIADSLGEAKAYLDGAKSKLTSLVTDYNEKLQEGKTEASAQIIQEIGTITSPEITFDGTNIMVGETPVSLTYTDSNPVQINKILVQLSGYITATQNMIDASTDANLQTEYANYLDADSQLAGTVTAVKAQQIVCGTVNQTALADDLKAAVDKAVSENILDESTVKDILDPCIVDFSDSLEDGDTLTNVLQSNSKAVQKAIDEKSDILKMDTAKMSNAIDADIVAPLVNRADSTKNNLIALYDDEKKELTEFQKSVKNYDPLANIDNGVIQGYLGDLMTNNQQMQTTVAQNYQDNMKFVGDVYKNAEVNTTTLQQNILEANQLSNQAVTDSLAASQKAKEKTSNTNQTLLADFTTKLPYTRIGELEYAKASNFIIRPVSITEVSQENQKQPKSVVTEKTNVKAEAEKTPVITKLLYIVLAILIVLVVTVIAVRTAKRKKETNRIS